MSKNELEEAAKKYAKKKGFALIKKLSRDLNRLKKHQENRVKEYMWQNPLANYKKCNNCIYDKEKGKKL